MRRTAFLVAATLFASGALAEEANLPEADEKYPSGFLSQGDSSDIVEDFFGSRVERPAPRGKGAASKYDPAIRWDDRPITR